MFEILMLVGFLGAGLCHMLPEGETGCSENEKAAKRQRRQPPAGKTSLRTTSHRLLFRGAPERMIRCLPSVVHRRVASKYN
jgi:hypothetical protein